MQIIECLESAISNINTSRKAKMPEVLEIALIQINNVIDLLKKGYDVNTDVDEILDQYEDISQVPPNKKE